MLAKLRSFLATRVRAGEPLPGCEIVHRAILKARWLDEHGDATAEAFLLRPADHGCLSVCRRALSPWARCRTHFNKVYGGVPLRVRPIRAVAPRVETVADPEPGRPEHASIINLPDPATDRGAAERAATLLMAQARRL